MLAQTQSHAPQDVPRPSIPQMRETAESDASHISVGNVRHTMSSDELERHIASCGYLMLEAYGRYEETGCFGDKGEAHRWRLLMQEGIAARNPLSVARLEAARGLA